MQTGLSFTLISLFCAGLVFSPVHAFGQITSNDPMSPLINQAGLGHLSDEDKAKVSALMLHIYSLATQSGGCPNSGVIESKVDGESEGWSGETILKLRNGQIWQQTEYKYKYKYKYSPDVLIVKQSGRWKMKLGDIDEFVGVECIS